MASTNSKKAKQNQALPQSGALLANYDFYRRNILAGSELQDQTTSTVGAASTTRMAFNVPDVPFTMYGFRWVQGASSDLLYAISNGTGLRARAYVGKTYTLSFYYSCTTAQFGKFVVQWNVGGVTYNLNGSGNSAVWTTSGEWAPTAAIQPATASGVWRRMTLTLPQLPQLGTASWESVGTLELRSLYRNTSNFTADVTGFMVNEGSIALPYERTEDNQIIRDGLLNRNIHRFSYDLTHADWAKANAPITAGAPSYKGDNSAFYIADNSTLTNHQFTQTNYVYAGNTYTWSIVVKQVDAAANWLHIPIFYDGATGVSYITFSYNLIAGTSAGSANVPADYSGITTSITSLGNGYYRLTGTATIANQKISKVQINARINISGGNYSGDGLNKLILEEPMLEQSASFTSHQRSGYHAILGASSTSETTEPTFSGAGLRGDGVDDRILLPYQMFSSDTITVALAFRSDSRFSGTPFFTASNINTAKGFRLNHPINGSTGVNFDYPVRLRTTDGVGQTFVDFPAGKTQVSMDDMIIFSITRSTGAYKLYKNGVITTGTSANPPDGVLTTAYFLSHEALTGFSDATLYLSSIWNVILSDAEMIQTERRYIKIMKDRGIDISGRKNGLVFETDFEKRNLVRNSELFNSLWATTAMFVPTLSGSDWNFIPTATSGNHQLSQNAFYAIAGTTYTCTIKAKPNGYDGLIFAFSSARFGGTDTFVNMSTGATIIKPASVTYTRTASDSGYFLYSFTATATSNGLTTLFFGIGDTSGSTFAFTADGVSGILVQWVQVERANYFTSYEKTGTGQFVRDISVSGKNLLLPNSQDISTWSTSASGSGTTPTISTGLTDRYGGSTAFRLQANQGAGGTSSDFSYISRGTMDSFINGTTSVFSIWMRSNTGSSQEIYITGSTSSNVNKLTVTTTWTRYSIVVTSGTSVFIGSRGTINSTASVDILMMEPQWELGSMPTVYERPQRSVVLGTNSGAESADALFTGIGLYMDGNTYAGFVPALTVGSNYTFSAITKTSTLSTIAVIVGGSNAAHYLGYSSTRIASSSIQDSSSTQRILSHSKTNTLGTTNLNASMVSGTVQSIFDGYSKISQTNTNTATSATVNFFGRLSNAVTNNYIGEMYYASIYDRPLSDLEWQNYASETQRKVQSKGVVVV